jgi:hypothetical protein
LTALRPIVKALHLLTFGTLLQTWVAGGLIALVLLNGNKKLQPAVWPISRNPKKRTFL